MRTPIVKASGSIKEKPVKLATTERKAFVKQAVALGASAGLFFGHPMKVAAREDFSLRESFETPISIVKPTQHSGMGERHMSLIGQNNNEPSYKTIDEGKKIDGIPPGLKQPR